jgi:hypothetical protein
MPRMEFEPTIQEFERANIVYALDRVSTVIGGDSLYQNKLEPKLLILITNI